MNLFPAPFLAADAVQPKTTSPMRGAAMLNRGVQSGNTAVFHQAIVAMTDGNLHGRACDAPGLARKANNT